MAAPRGRAGTWILVCDARSRVGKICGCSQKGRLLERLGVRDEGEVKELVIGWLLALLLHSVASKKSCVRYDWWGGMCLLGHWLAEALPIYRSHEVGGEDS